VHDPQAADPLANFVQHGKQEFDIPVHNQTTPSGSLLIKLLWQHMAPSHERVSAVIMIFITTFIFALPLERPRCLHFLQRENHYCCQLRHISVWRTRCTFAACLQK